MSYKSQYTGSEIDELLTRVNSVKEYSVLLTQSVLGPPAVVYIQKNEFNNPVTFSRTAAGDFEIHCQDFTDMQTTSKIHVMFNHLISSKEPSPTLINTTVFAYVSFPSGDLNEIVVLLRTYELSVSGSQIITTLADGVISTTDKLLITIKIYS